MRPSPAVSKRSVRSISPHRPSDSEDEDSTPSKHVPVIADVHEPTPAAASAVGEDSTVQTEAEGEEKTEGNDCFLVFYCERIWLLSTGKLKSKVFNDHFTTSRFPVKCRYKWILLAEGVCCFVQLNKIKLFW